jgi:hypothetical protein
MSEKRICKAVKANGQGCRAGALPGQEWCFNHDPRRAEERRENAAIGGKSRSRRRAHEVSRIKKRIEDATGAVLRGELNSATAAVAFQGFNVLLRSVEVERRVREADDFEGRIAELEIRARGNG